MNLRLVFCLFAGICTTLGSFIMIVAHVRRPPPLAPPPKPNFHAASEEVVDEATGAKTIYREFTISTKLMGHKGGAGGAGSDARVPVGEVGGESVVPETGGASVGGGAAKRVEAGSASIQIGVRQ